MTKSERNLRRVFAILPSAFSGRSALKLAGAYAILISLLVLRSTLLLRVDTTAGSESTGIDVLVALALGIFGGGLYAGRQWARIGFLLCAPLGSLALAYAYPMLFWQQDMPYTVLAVVIYAPLVCLTSSPTAMKSAGADDTGWRSRGGLLLLGACGVAVLYRIIGTAVHTVRDQVIADLLLVNYVAALIAVSLAASGPAFSRLASRIWIGLKTFVPPVPTAVFLVTVIWAVWWSSCTMPRVAQQATAPYVYHTPSTPEEVTQWEIEHHGPFDGLYPTDQDIARRKEMKRQWKIASARYREWSGRWNGLQFGLLWSSMLWLVMAIFWRAVKVARRQKMLGDEVPAARTGALAYVPAIPTVVTLLALIWCISWSIWITPGVRERATAPYRIDIPETQEEIDAWEIDHQGPYDPSYRTDEEKVLERQWEAAAERFDAWDRKWDDLEAVFVFSSLLWLAVAAVLRVRSVRRRRMMPGDEEPPGSRPRVG